MAPSPTPAHLAEVRKREGSWYDYPTQVPSGGLVAAIYKGNPNHESSYTIFGLVVRYGDGFTVRIPKPLLYLETSK